MLLVESFLVVLILNKINICTCYKTVIAMGHSENNAISEININKSADFLILLKK